MKIILSRKGFDSQNGGYPNPILPDGRLISLPIPSDDNIKYSNLSFEDETYFDIMKKLNKKIRYKNSWISLTEQTRCHFDPDLEESLLEREINWKPSFGQINQAQSHLANQGVKIDDLFLFFGWFKQTKFKSNGELEFEKLAPDLHVIFGYLQIGEIIKLTKEDEVPTWMDYHPHTDRKRIVNPTNRIYIARKSSNWNEAITGAGTFYINDQLILTKEGYSRSKWDLPKIFRDVNISYHSADSWKSDGYFKSVDKGQEFVVEDSKQIEHWAKRLIENTNQ